jgi:Flp pilus assembly protein TadD
MSVSEPGRLKPDFWGVFYFLGRAKLQMNLPAEAVPLLERAVQLNGDEESVFYQLGLALRACGRKTEAQRAMAKVRDLKEAARIDLQTQSGSPNR